MNFCDEAEIKIKSGNGGNGLMSFKHTRNTYYGGPDGGDGGKGGDIILRADHNINTLIDYHTKKHFSAPNGSDGLDNQKHGKSGEDMVLTVPVGTIIKERRSKKILFDVVKNGEEIVLLRGGRGGFGNKHFCTSKRQSPHFAEKGELGFELDVTMELKLVADVGIIGYPSVGKSTFISVVSNARPKIAAYEFTTLVPNLGSVKIGGQDFVMCDVPGLIAGASTGKGLGDKFLRHVERCRILLHLIDITHADIVEDYRVIQKELKDFSKKLARKPQLIALNKIDTVSEKDAQTSAKEFTKTTRKKVFLISAVAKSGVEELMYELKDLLAKHPRKEMVVSPEKTTATGEVVSDDYHLFQPHLEVDEFAIRNYEIKKRSGTYVVTGKRIEQIAGMTDWNNEEAVMRIYDIMKKIGITKKLMRAGVKTGKIIRIGKYPIEFVEY